MKVLVLGGTRFVGRHIVESLLARGHQLTVFNRGQSHDDLPPSVERLRGDRDGGAAALHVLDGRRWDACIDVSGYTPRQVRPSAERLCSRGTHYVYVSAVMTYGDAQERPVREPRAERGYRKLFLQSVTQADHGVDFDFMRAAQIRGRVPKA